SSARNPARSGRSAAPPARPPPVPAFPRSSPRRAAAASCSRRRGTRTSAGRGPAGGAGAGLDQPPVHLGRFIWLRCDDAGWWEPVVRPGETVTEGQLLGTVSSIDGAEILQTIIAPTAGVPMFVTS